ncbi:NTF2-like protein [Xylona heveae TC161]|uniref:NTF2-like protein n=1 Tax=Xylona heveae (strain CBS 132557 / TC161) TaxID=1328760 RepID=A0A161TQU3_XYLHT|nr:NTF2-like protein [Xylona heveae TC161]KZF24746.1 NTF2-like protein [Xylona heveae TC161]
MTALNVDVATRVSTDAAERFVESYYPALQNARSTLASYYVAPSAMPDGKPIPAIVFNGNIIQTAADFQAMFENQMPPVFYDVQCYDCQVLNPSLVTAGAQTAPPESGKNMTILLMVSGYIRFGELRDGPIRGFSETIVLAPNPEAAAIKGRGKSVKGWLIQSQNFRMVV